MRKLALARRASVAALAFILTAGLTGSTSRNFDRPTAGDALASRAVAHAAPALTESPGRPHDARAASASAGEWVRSAYDQLPLSFEQNAGQFERGVGFAARGDGYSVSLKPTEAVLDLREPPPPPAEESPSRAAGLAARRASNRIRVRMRGANPAARAKGVERLPGVSNYLIGRDPAAWRTNVANFAKVEYAGVYPGVDLVYYGNGRRLEYDFLVAPGADPQQIALEFDGAEDLRLDANGDLVLRTGGGGELRQLKPVSYQLIEGSRREVESRYALGRGGEVGVELVNYDPEHALVIDPILSYSTFLGGTGFDEARALARGSDGSLYVAGVTNSTEFPGAGGLQPALRGSIDAFVLKLNAAGTAVVYATYLGGNGTDEGAGVAVDADGSAYVVGFTQSADFPATAGALQTALDGRRSDAFAAKLNAAGTALAYATYLGGPASDAAVGVAVDGVGRAHVAGFSFSSRFLGARMQKAGSPVYKSANAAAGWQPAENGIDDSTATSFAVHPTDPNVVYAGTNVGIYKTTDGGATWSLTGSGNAATDPVNVTALLLDPFNPSTLYATSSPFNSQSGGVYKTTDAGATYTRDTSLGSTFSIAADPSAPGTLYAGAQFGANKSTDGGATWTAVNNGLPSSGSQRQVNRFAVDPTNTQTVYAATPRGVYKTTNGGASWAAVNNGIIGQFSPTVAALSIVLEPSAPSTLYAGTTSGVFKTTNGGASWTPVNSGLQIQTPTGLATRTIVALAIDPATPSILYAGTTSGGVFKTTDAGATWSASNAGLANFVGSQNALEVARSNPSTIYAGFNSGADAFVVRLNPAGSAADYSVFLGGSEEDSASGIALDPSGNAYVAGVTGSTDLPLASPLQAASGGGLDAFVAKFNPAGTAIYSTYLGGGNTDDARAVAVDQNGRAHVTGFTNSPNFPTAGPRQTALNDISSDAFVARLSAGGSSLEYSVLHGGQFQEEGRAVALDSAGNAYVTGVTASVNFPVVNNAQPGYGGGTDAFVLKLGPASEVIYSTYLGGSESERGFGVAADAAGTAYVVGGTNSSNFPVASPLDSTYGDGGDAFFARLTDSAGTACSYSISPGPLSVPNTGSAGSNINVTASAADCAWTAVSNASWITITAGASGQGNGTASFSVAAHDGSAPRTGTITVAGQTFTVTQSAPPPAIRFAQTSYQVSEGAGRATVTATRTGDVTAAASVNYQTVDADTFTVGCADAAAAQGSAFARCDFATAVGTINFAAGESTKTINVPLIDDAHVEANETFQVLLSSASGATLLGPNATVTITDNDTASQPNPVVASHAFFVRQQYLDFLSREPDDAGFNAWLNVLNNCQPSANTGPEVASGCDRIYVSGEGFFRSVEFQLKGFYVFRFYKVAFNRLPEYTEIISDMSFVAGATEQEVYARRAELARGFMSRREFQDTYNPMTNQQYVAALLGRYNLQQATAPDPASPDTSQKVTLTRAELTNRLDAGTLTRAQALRFVADSDEVGAAEFDSAFVAMQYYGYLRRKPEPAGYEDWLRVLQSGDTRTMVNGFLNSAEYKLRFGQP